METQTLKAEVRELSGKGPARQLRMKGLIPAVFYGPGKTPTNLSVAPDALRKILSGAYGRNQVVELQIDGRSELSLVRDLEIHPLTRAVLHADFYAVSLERPVRANVSEVMNVIGDIEGRDCVILDDMIDTAGTLTNAAKALKDKGARTVSAAATHPVLSGPAVERIANSVLEEVVVSDTIPLSAAALATGKFQVLGVARLLGEAIKRIHNGDSVSSLFV